MLSAGDQRGVVHEAEIAEGDGGEAAGIGGVGGGFGDERVGGPVEVDFAEPASFCDEGGEGGGWFVEDVGVVVGGDCFVEGVDGGELVGHGSFDDGVPAEWVDGIGAGGDAEDLGVVAGGVFSGFGVVAGGGELDCFFVFGKAPYP
jgi:hypothetical protein